MKRTRLRIEGVKCSGSTAVSKTARAGSIPATSARPYEYKDSRWYILHELRQLRAKRRISGINTTKDIKKYQRDLAGLRREYSL